MPNTQAPSLLVELDYPQALEASIVGSKAASLADLIEKGAIVPAGFAIPANLFRDFIDPVKTEISEILKTVHIEVLSSAFEAADSIAILLKTVVTPAGLFEAINTRISSASTGLAVRSSATAEDLEGASFAGMYDTFLDATDTASVLQRVRDVWTSYYTGRAISYRQRQGIAHEAGSMSVLIMELVNADAGGVIFTRDPRDGTDQILINVALGLGEGVVSGEAQADSFTLNSETFEITNRNVIDKQVMFVQGTTGSTDKVPVPADKRSSPALSDEQLIETAKAATAIKEASGDDRDIEFAVVGETVHILQSRPITTGAKQESETEFSVEWENSEDEKLAWRLGSKTPSLPLVIEYVKMAGVAEKRSVDFTGEDMGRWDRKKWTNGYIYNAETPRNKEKLDALSLKHHLMGRRHLEKGSTYFYDVIEPELLKNLAEIEAVRPADDAPFADHIVNLRRAMQLAADHQCDLHWRSWAGFKTKDDLSKLFAEITGRPEVESSDLILGIDHMTARLSARMISMSKLVKSDAWLTEVFESRNYDAIFARGNGSRPTVAKFRLRFSSFMKIWGRRNGIGYGSAWKPTDPSWNMEPEIPLDSIGSYVRQNLDTQGRSHANLKARREAAIKAVRQKIGRNTKLRKKFDFELFRGTHHIKMMENHNYLIEQCTFGEYRESINRAAVSLTDGRWIDTPNDIYYLLLTQLEDAAHNNDYSELRSQIIDAKEQFSEDSKLTPLPFIGAKLPDVANNDEEDPLRGISEDGQLLHGEPSSAGSFTGVARVVITRSSTPPDIRKDEILVTENTGPDWVPVFPLLGGLVLDGGDNFQHASLIAREYGIPCVIQTKDATAKIADGQLISLDGTAGTVTLNPMV
ncbi:MAG: PEP-utilizing enzyme [Dehalococcoidia bacterium]|nr:PEP-utilizing enzyme [Dehalococcoidia bacterium]